MKIFAFRNFSREFWNLFFFVWILFLVLQQGQRLSLLPEAMTLEAPLRETLITTSITGFQADAIISTVGIGFAAILAWFSVVLRNALSRTTLTSVLPAVYTGMFRIWTWIIGVGLMLVLTIDMGYYHFAHTHLDFVFFEYVEDLLFPREDSGGGLEQTSGPTQALQQTEAELHQFSKWSWIVAIFIGWEVLFALGWWVCFRTFISPFFLRWHSDSPQLTQALLTGCLICGLMGFNVYGPLGIHRANISSSVYYMLAQNPIWYAGEVWIESIGYRISGAKANLLKTMPLEEALNISRQILATQEQFSHPQFPLLKTTTTEPTPRFKTPVNILLIFVEGLDRRYLGRTVDIKNPRDLRKTFFNNSPPYQEQETQPSSSSQPIRLTPFLDHLGENSIFFEHFFSNGDMTARALFSTLCSYFPRRGWAVMKTRYTHEFLCLPEVFQTAGYWTEMIVGQNRDRNFDHIALFLAKNGIHQFLDENNFPSHAQRIGVGLTDESLFEFVRDRVKSLRTKNRPYFLSTLTVGTHHPYQYPETHPDVKALQPHPDQYVPALRYLDFAIEKFFISMQEEDLFENTIVFVLGDHGRHEGIGESDPAARGSHFLVPLYIWIDPSLESNFPTRTKIISEVASQVDIAPTILAMTHLTPQHSPFLGRDLTCALYSDCLVKNIAYLSGAHDDSIGLVNQEFMWLYRFRTKNFFRTSLDGQYPANDKKFPESSLDVTNTDSPLVQVRTQMFGLYVSSNFLLEEGRIWSKNRFGKTLYQGNLAQEKPD